MKTDKNDKFLKNNRTKIPSDSIIKLLPGSIYYKDVNGVYLGANEHALHMVGFQAEEEIVGKTDFDLFLKKDAQQFRKNDCQVMQTGKDIVAKEEVISPDGKKLIQISTKKALWDQDGNLLGIIGNTINITELLASSCK